MPEKVIITSLKKKSLKKSVESTSSLCKKAKEIEKKKKSVPRRNMILSPKSMFGKDIEILPITETGKMPFCSKIITI